MIHRSSPVFATAIAALIGCASDPLEPEVSEETEELAACPAVPVIDINRSLFVSPTIAVEQQELRTRFAVSRIMSHILASAGTQRPVDGTELWQRWWDSQNDLANQVFDDTPHCDDNNGTINGFGVQCPRNEGSLAGAVPDSHFPVALVYRPDLAPRDGSSCGEARIVIAKPNTGSRNLPIFEARIPNPSPGCGFHGCRKIAQFWAKLSSISSFSQRLDALERFYFTGLTLAQDGVVTKPVLNASNFGLPSNDNPKRLGQIRTNQFMTGPHHGQLWQLREFKLNIDCIYPNNCKVFMEPVSDKTNPFGVLFNDNNPHPQGAPYRNEFLTQLVALSPNDVNKIGMSVTNTFNAGQSNSQGNENLYPLHFNQGSGVYEATVNAKLAALGIPLTADNMVQRALTQSCGGCHQLSNGAPLGGLDSNGNPLVWPSSAQFVHTLENGNRSPALNNFFLPRRKEILEDFLRVSCPQLCTLPTHEPIPTTEAESLPLAGHPMVH